MRFTAQEEYGLRCILGLARAWGGGVTPASEPEAETPQSFLTLSSIAEREGVSVQYAGKLFRILAQASLVESVRGCKGGYKLSRDPGTIHVGEVLACLGGKMYEPKTCERYSGDRRFCVHTNDCSIRSLWMGLQLMIDAVLTRTTLKDLIGSERSVSEWMGRHVDAVAQLVGSEDGAAVTSWSTLSQPTILDSNSDGHA